MNDYDDDVLALLAGADETPTQQRTLTHKDLPAPWKRPR